MRQIKNSVVTIFLLVGAAALSACQTPAPAINAPASTSTSSPSPKTTPAAEPKTLAADAGRTLANNCFTCHGPDGRSPGTIPSLSALRARDISSQMKRFRSGDITTTVMGRLAKGYSDAEIDAMAEYIATLGK